MTLNEEIKDAWIFPCMRIPYRIQVTSAGKLFKSFQTGCRNASFI